jgi:hypothetical protein
VIDRARMFAVVALLAAADASAARLTIDLPGASIPLDIAAGYSTAALTLSTPDGRVVQSEVGSNVDHIKLSESLLAGQYHYRIDFGAATSATSAGNGSDGRDSNVMTSRTAFAPVEGSFRYEGGHAYVADASSKRTDASAPGGAVPNDVVTADDAIIQGSLCVGLDCVNNEAFGFDTLMLKENNTRIHFNDTSASAGFPNTNWQLTANDSTSGGLNKFSIEDLTAATVPFTVLGAAPSNAIYIDSSGRVGFRTSTPALDLHVVTNDTPAIRFDQSNAGGFTAQTWDIAGNEANFFVRDLTGGSRLPFRIRPGAPTSSIDIAANGFVGFGVASPGAHIDIASTVSLASPVAVLRINNGDASVASGQTDRFVVDSSGNVLARGTISQLSSRSAKENFSAIDNRVLLAKLDRLPVSSWNYRGAPEQERHVGPVAEDFHAAFELGASNRYIAPADMAGVALASVKALQEEIKQRDEKIQRLEERLFKLESRLDATKP